MKPRCLEPEDGPSFIGRGPAGLARFDPGRDCSGEATPGPVTAEPGRRGLARVQDGGVAAGRFRVRALSFRWQSSRRDDSSSVPAASGGTLFSRVTQWHHWHDLPLSCLVHGSESLRPRTECHPPGACAVARLKLAVPKASCIWACWRSLFRAAAARRLRRSHCQMRRSSHGEMP
jgi:hypothetical protein